MQGLSDQDQQFERKSELMTSLFAANIELRVKLDAKLEGQTEPAETAMAAVPDLAEPLELGDTESRFAGLWSTEAAVPATSGRLEVPDLEVESPAPSYSSAPSWLQRN